MEAFEPHPPLREPVGDYERGYLDALWSHAVWKDGVPTVGSCGKTYQRAARQFLDDRDAKAAEYTQPPTQGR